MWNNCGELFVVQGMGKAEMLAAYGLCMGMGVATVVAVKIIGTVMAGNFLLVTGGRN